MKPLSLLALIVGGVIGWYAAGAIAARGVPATFAPAALGVGFLSGLLLLPMMWRVWRWRRPENSSD